MKLPYAHTIGLSGSILSTLTGISYLGSQLGMFHMTYKLIILTEGSGDLSV